MKLFAVFTILSAVLAFTEGCGKRHFTSRVVGGENAPKHSWPWQVSLRITYNGKLYHICGGSLVGERHVVTASHCVVDRNDKPNQANMFTVVVGAHKRTGTTDVQQAIKVKKLFAHEGFSYGHLRNDIALLELESPVTLSDKVNTVCLPIQDSRITDGHKCYITGWGRTVGGGDAADTLQQAMLPVQNPQKCATVNRPLAPVDEKSMICGGSGVADQAGGCQGDSGGPYVCEENGKWVLRGAVSWGHGMCRTEYFTVFARVSSFREWIDEKMSAGEGSGAYA